MLEDKLVAEAADPSQQEGESGVHHRQDQAQLVLDEEGKNGVADRREKKEGQAQNRLGGGQDQQQGQQGTRGEKGGGSPGGGELQKAPGQGRAKGGEMNLGAGHGVGVRGFEEILGPVSVGAHQDKFVLQHFPVLKDLLPCRGHEKLVDGDRLVVEVGLAGVTDQARGTLGNPVTETGLLQHAAAEGNSGGILKGAAIMGGADDAVGVGPKVDVADATVGIVGGDFVHALGCQKGGEGKLDGGAAKVADLLKGSADHRA